MSDMSQCVVCGQEYARRFDDETVCSDSCRQIQPRLAALAAENDVLRAALRIYARRPGYGADHRTWNWREVVCDAYSGGVWHFDFHGDEADSPWEPAERALARTEAKKEAGK